MIDDERTGYLLRLHLECAVPLKMQELEHYPRDLLAGIARSTGVLDVIAYRADLFLYRNRDTAWTFNALVTGLACAALLNPDGVTFAGLHFQATERPIETVAAL